MLLLYNAPSSPLQWITIARQDLVHVERVIRAWK